MLNGFSKKYNLTKLLYFEKYHSPLEAIKREKQLKAWKREWKLELIKGQNANFKDLFKEILY